MFVLVQKIMRTYKRLQTKQAKRVKDRPVSKYQLKNPEPVVETSDKLNGYNLKLIRGTAETLKALENKLIFIAVGSTGKVYKPIL